MAKPNPNNAHVRGESKRQAVETIAADADRLLNDPAFIQGFNGLREDTVKLLEATAHDGSPEFDAAEREMCRTLRTLSSLRRRIGACVQNQTLRIADFKPIDPEKEDK